MSVANMEAGNNEPVKTSSWIDRVKEYYADLKAEMGKVSWPSREQVVSTTAVVIACVFAFALYFAVVDVVLAKAIRRLFDTLAK